MALKLKQPKNDVEDLRAVIDIGGNRVKTIKALSEWQAQGIMLSDIAEAKGVSSQYLEDYWVKYTEEDFRLKTRRLQGDAFWAKALKIFEDAGDKKISANKARLAAHYQTTAKLLHPEKWDPSLARKKAKANAEKSKEENDIPYGVDQDFGDGNIAPHVRAIKGGVTHDITPRYDDAFNDDSYDPRAKLVSRLISTRPNPFDSLNWKKLIKSNVAQEPQP